MKTPLKSELAAHAVSVCLCLHTRKAARAVTQVFDHALVPTGLKATQLSVLMVINEHGTINIGELALTLVTDSTTMSKSLKPLVTAGLVSRATEAKDRRVKVLSLTNDGLAALEHALPLWQEAQTRVARALGGLQIQRLLPGLEAAANLGSKAYK